MRRYLLHGKSVGVFLAAAALISYQCTAIAAAQQLGAPSGADRPPAGVVNPPGLGPRVSPIICTMEYAPVCARARDGVWRTYPNACHAHRENVIEVVNGPCR